jgi:NADPH2:quinone reductase
MRAVQISRYGGSEVLQLVENVAVPKLLDSSGPMVLIKNEFMGVNYIDTYQRSGLYPVAQFPATLGREGAGLVTQSTSAKFQVGDRVAYFSPSAYADYVAVPESKVAKVPAEIELQVGAASLLQGLTALAFTTVSYPVVKGTVALVHAAAGGTGSNLVQMIKAFGGTVIGTTTSESKVSIAKAIGCDHVILNNGSSSSLNSSNTNSAIVDEVMKLTDGQGVHVVYDGVGKATFDTSLACVRRHGTLITFGNASGKVDPVDPLRLTKGSIRLMRPTLFDYVVTDEEFQSCKFQRTSLLYFDI